MRRASFSLHLICTAGFALFIPSLMAQDGPPLGFVSKLGQDMDVRSGARILKDDVTSGNVILPDINGPVAGGSAVPQIQLRGGNVQVNDPAQTAIQIFPGFRPFVRATRSETSVAAFENNIVVTYNNSTGIHVIRNPGGPGLVVDRVQFSGYSVSHDSGRTWNSDYMPGSAGTTDTFGDPSVGVDRNGIFYFANLGDDTAHGTIQVNKSIDGGNTWSTAVIVQEDDGSDKDWLAVGPDPLDLTHDNVYVTWTSFQDDGSCQLRFGVSTNGGATFSAKTIFAPTSDPNPTHPQNCLQFSNPVVDRLTGSLYVPFLRFSNSDQDFIQMLISNDAGQTFHFATFSVPGAPSTTVMPVTQPGELTSCGTNNVRLTIHTSLNTGPGKFGLPRYVQASRMILQPTIAARNGKVYLAWSNSTSPFFGDPAGGSNILFISSSDGGQTWSNPITVNPLVATDKHHVMPSLAIDQDPNDVHISYYTQHQNGTVDLDMSNSHDSGSTFPANRNVRVTSTSLNLSPTNIRLTNAPTFSATNYDRQIAVCYALGEYQSVTSANGTVYAAWGDTRNQITELVNALDPISGQTHPEEDVFFQKVKVQ